ncbi:MAG: hypothetical protein OXS29_19370 [bacterium]|nr:hypothetical protein [bacterium]MDE0439949.1 hypothetical protein [bacterium]
MLVAIALVAGGPWAWQRARSIPADAAAAAVPHAGGALPIPAEPLVARAGSASPSAAPMASRSGEPAVPPPQQDAARTAIAGDGQDTEQSEPEPDEVPEATEPPSGQTYTYWDGDAQRTVTLVPVDPDDGAGAGGASGSAGSDRLMFRSEQGVAMALDHSIVVVLDPDWSIAEVDQFFARNGIPQSSVSPLGWLPNGFAIATGPGIASLELANTLAPQDGVVLSSPNWATEVELK